MKFIEESIRILRDNGYKITGPRQAVLEVLGKTHSPLSAHDIEDHIPGNIPINVVTIYRVLEVFEKLGIAHRVHTKEGYIRCDFEKQQGCHTFAVCDHCGRADEFIQKNCEMEDQILKTLPYSKLKHLSEISGTCDQCTLNTI